MGFKEFPRPLKKVYGEVIIPEAVYRELSIKEDSVCKRAVDSSLDWIRVDKIKNQMAKSMYKTQLHDGEVEVMILAKEITADGGVRYLYFTGAD